MLTHTVLFWAKDDLSAAARSEFEANLRKLLTISWVQTGWVGVPAGTSRSVVDRSYTFALTVRFADLAAHDAYQTDPIHADFLARCGGYWQKVVVYDYDDISES